MDAAVGVDLGSSSAKLSLVGVDGTLLATAERPYAASSPREGWREIDPELWWRAVREAMAELVRSAPQARIRSVGTTGQMHTTVFVDAEGRSVRPAIMWNDSRTAAMVAPMRERLAGLGLAGDAQIVSTGSPLLNLRWLHDEEPQAAERLSTFLIGPDWIVHRLAGTIGTDHCEASTSSLFDFASNGWSEPAAALAGLAPGQLPEIRGACSVVGTVLPEVAEELGLPGDVEVIAGTGDNPAAAIPTGCLTEGRPVLSLGTSGVLMFSREAPDFAARGKNIVVSLDGQRMQTLVQGVVQSCGSTREWWDLRIARFPGHAESDAAVDPSMLGHNPVIFFPHLTGEKTLYADASLRGALVGLSTDATPGALSLAVMEGVAFGMRELAERMGLDVRALDGLQVIGGGSRSDVWMRVLANVLGTRVLRMEGAASAGYGAALLALAASCGIDLDATCRRALRVREAFAPEPDIVAAYDAQYERYLRVHDAIKQIDAG